MEKSYSRYYPTLYRGVVESNVDPKKLGRCKIRVPSIHGELTYPVSMLPWARPVVTSHVHKNRGSVNLPDVGDIVWVFFEEGVKEFPVYLGGTYALDELDISNDIVDFYIENDTKLSYHRKNKILTIKIDDTEIEVSPEKVKITGDTELIGSLSIKGKLSITEGLSVGGTTTLENLVITGTCNQKGEEI